MKETLESLLINHLYSENRNLFFEYALLSDNLVIILNPDLSFQCLNKSAEKTLGISFEQAMKANLRQFLDNINDSVLIASHDNLTTEIKILITRPSGEHRCICFNSRLILNKESELDSILLWGKDVTEQIEYKEKQHAVGKYINIIFSQLPVSVFWKDTHSNYFGCNDYMTKLIQFSDYNEIIGKSDFDLPWDKKEAEGYRKGDKEIFQSKNPKFNIIEPLTISRGKTEKISTTKVPIYDELNRVFGIAGFFFYLKDNKAANLIRLSNLYLKEFSLSFQEKSKYIQNSKGKIVKLSTRQAECLTHIAMGMSAKETGRLLNQSPRTIETHIQRLKIKLEIDGSENAAKYFWDNPIQWF